MNDNEVIEMLNLLGYGETPPEALMDVIRTFRKRKCSVFPLPLEPSDVVTATMLYDICTEKKKKDK